MNKLLKALISVWAINLIVFTASLFLHSYYEHIQHWSAGAWQAVFFASTVIKIMTSFLILMNIKH